MSKIEKYKKQNGSVAYMVKAYLGYDLESGKQKQTTKRGFRTKKEAKDYLVNLEAEINKNGIPNKQKTTFKEIFDEWFDEHQKQIKPSTSNTIKSKFTQRILPKFGHLAITKITPKYCQQVVNEWSNEIKSYKDLKIQANLVFKYSVKMNYISQNPLDKIIMPSPKEEHYILDNDGNKQNYYTREELLDFLQVIQHEPLNHTFFHLAGYTGARKGELLALNWSDINFEDGLMNLNKTMFFDDNSNHLLTPKYSSSGRVISLDSHTLNVLKNWKVEQQKQYTDLSQPISNDEQQFVFTKYHQFKKRNEPVRSAYFNDQLKRITKENPSFRKINVHGFRHTHASLLISSKATPNEVKERLGHADIQTTFNTYVHLMEKERVETANKFHDFMNK